MTIQLVRGALGQQGADWTPAQLDGTTGLRWYDFSDTSTISDTGGLIDSIADKYAGGYDLTGTTTTRPTTGAATLNGLNVATFAADYLNAASAADWKFLHDGTDHIVSMLVKVGTTSNPGVPYCLFGTNGTSLTTPVGTSLFYDDRTSQSRDDALVLLAGAGSSQTVASPSTPNGFMPANRWRIVTIISDLNNGTAANRVGVVSDRCRPQFNNIATASPSAANPTYVFQLGAGGNNAAPLTGQIAEVVMTSSHADRWRIEDYFVRKYALTPAFAVQLFADQVTVTA